MKPKREVEHHLLQAIGGYTVDSIDSRIYEYVSKKLYPLDKLNMIAIDTLFYILYGANYYR